MPNDLESLAEEPAAELLTAREGGERLDRWLTARLPGRSRAEVQRWIAAGDVTLDGRSLKASYRLAPGDVISVRVPATTAYNAEPEPISIDIIYEDSDLILVDKPAGLVVHPAAGHWRGTLVNAVLHHCPDLEGVGGTGRPGIVHRLDKDTSGLILVAKNDAAHRALQAQFKERAVHKEYLALVYGYPSPAQGLIDASIARDPRNRKRMAVMPAGQGRPAQTRYEAVAYYRAGPVPRNGVARFALLRCQPLTGRTHQIRVHMAYSGYPIVGDPVYAARRRAPAACVRQFLHAHRLRFRLPSSGEEVEFTSPLPSDLETCLASLFADA